MTHSRNRTSSKPPRPHDSRGFEWLYPHQQLSPALFRSIANSISIACCKPARKCSKFNKAKSRYLLKRDDNNDQVKNLKMTSQPVSSTLKATNYLALLTAVLSLLTAISCQTSSTRSLDNQGELVGHFFEKLL